MQIMEWLSSLNVEVAGAESVTEMKTVALTGEELCTTVPSRRLVETGTAVMFFEIELSSTEVT
jgi:hypothetical protein